MSNKHPCDDLTPTDNCNKTNCPDYVPDSDWCNAFNKRTLEQLKETTQTSIDGMWVNIEDAKNTISQAEQYLAMIYELLCASLDQVMKASSSTARTEGDFESASIKIIEFVNEIHLIVGGAQYNGRHLLQDTTTAKRGENNANFQADADDYGNIFPQEDAPHLSIALNGPVTASTTLLFVDTTGILVDDYISGTGTVPATVTAVVDGTTITVSVAQTIADTTSLSFTTSTQENQNGDSSIVVNDLVLNDIRINKDAIERSAIHYRLSGPRGACRNVGSVFNDFIYNLSSVGVHSLGLTAFTSSGGQDYHKQGLNAWTDDEGIISPDTTNDDDVDETITDFNCAIKTIGVELDKMRSYRYVLSLREKQIQIYKHGQNKCFEHKSKI